MKTRLALSAEDVAAIARLAAQMHASSTFADMHFDPLILGGTALRLMDSDDGLALVAETDDGQIIGGILALISPSFFGTDRVASELGVFVAPEHRGSRAAGQLVGEYVAWAKARDAKRINSGNSAGMDDEKYVRFMTRLGFQRAGSLMFMEV